jgi:hypothetical protein
MKQLLTIVTLSLGLFGATSLWAHHSLAAEYDQKKHVSLTGTVTKLDWRNPHAWVYLDVKNASGVCREVAMRTGFSQCHEPRRLRPGFR